MVVIDEAEYNELDAEAQTEKIDPFTGQIAKFKMDKFYGKDMDLPKLTKEKVNEWLDWLSETLPNQFKRNNSKEFKNIESIPLMELRPSFYSDSEAIERNLQAAEVAEVKMKDAEHFAKIKRKKRLKEFHACLLWYLKSECNATYKIKYDV